MASHSQEPPTGKAAAPKSRSRKTSTSTKSGESANSAAFSLATPDDLRLQWIAEAAYFIAERRGFADGSPDEDWLEAEAEIDRMLAATRH